MDALIDNIISRDGIEIMIGLMVLGKILKTTELINSWFIPIILLLVGTSMSVVLFGVNLHGFCQGILIGGAASGIHQNIKHLKYINNTVKKSPS